MKGRLTREKRLVDKGVVVAGHSFVDGNGRCSKIGMTKGAILNDITRADIT